MASFPQEFRIILIPDHKYLKANIDQGCKRTQCSHQIGSGCPFLRVFRTFVFFLGNHVFTS